MSIYFNFQIEGDRIDTKIANEQIRLASGTVVDDQSGYQVGIDRFKIPLSNIPLFRVYSNEYRMGIGFRGSPAWNGSGNPFSNISYSVSSFFGGNNIKINDGKYGIDNEYTTGLGALGTDFRIFRELSSQTEFVDMLNKGLAQSFSSALINQVANQVTTYTIPSPAGVNVFGSGANNNGISLIGQITIPNSAGTADTWAGELLASITLKIKRMDSSVPATPFDLSNFDFFLEQMDGATVLKTWFFNKGVMRGQSDFNGNTGVAADIDKQIEISLMGANDIDIQDLYDNSQYLANANLGTGIAFRTFTSCTNAAGVIGQRADHPTAASSYTYRLLVRNNTYQKNPANGINAQTATATDIECEIKTVKMSNIATSIMSQDLLTGGVDTLIPQFKYDNTLKKIYLSRNNIWETFWGMQLYMNDNLRKLMSFDEYKVYDIDTDQKALTYLSQGLTENATKFGAVYRFPLEIDKLNAGTDNGGREYNEWDEFYEANDTRFARDLLDAIVITSGSIATQGEIVGNGKFTRKTITDFKIDPSTTSRDYLIYNSDGGNRYYPLISTEALREVDIIVFFQDTKGVLRILQIPPNQVLSLKLEFRPNNMIFNYQV